MYIYQVQNTNHISLITNVTQNNTGIHTKESSQQTFKIPNNNLDVRFEQAYQHHNNETVQTRKQNKTSQLIRLNIGMNVA